MPQLNLKKTDELIEELFEGSDTWEQIYDKLVDSNRWSKIYELVVRHIPTGKFYMTDYSVGATEQQDEGPWENESEIILTEVMAVESKIIEYVPVK
jgi:hypothetical protein